MTESTSAAGAAVANINPSAVVNVLTGVNPVSASSGQGAGTAVAANGPAQARVNAIVQVNLPNASGEAQVVRTTTPPTQIPNTSLFKVAAAPTSSYLIETDPRFTNYRQWLSSDYMLGQIALDPTVTQKRLGDGFYEQRLIREQVAQLTGLRFVGDYTSDETQYRGLMDAGLTYAKAWNLRPGIALTPAQMAALTSDIVWLVQQEVTLADGSKQKVLVPQVYVRVREGDVDRAGSLLAGKEVNLNLTGDLTNAGTIAGRSVVNISADNVNNLAGRIHGNAVAVAAQTDLNNIGGTISANSQLQVSAGRDINIETTTRSASSTAGRSSFGRTTVDRVAGLYVTGDAAGGTLLASAGRDVNLTGGVIANGGTNGATLISAGRNLNLNTISTAASNTIVWDSKNHRSDSATTEIGSQIQTTGRVDLLAGQDINARAATVQAGGTLTAVAGNDINISAGKNTQSVDEAHQHTSNGLFSKKTYITHNTMASSTAVGSTLSGENVLLQSDRDVNIQGAAINADKALVVDAKRDVNVTAAQDTQSESHYSMVKREANGLGKVVAAAIAIADPISALTPNSLNNLAVAALLTKKAQTNDQATTSTTAVGSQMTGGTIDVRSGRDTLIQGANVVADGDVNIHAQRDLTITTAENTESGHAHSSEKTVGLLRFEATGSSVGKREQDQAQQNTAVTHTSSQIVSLGKGGANGNEGSVILNAVGNTTIAGSNVMAPAGDISISGANVVVNDVQNTVTQASQTHFRETSASVQLKSGYVDAAKGVYNSIQTARDAKKDTGSDRMAGLAALNAVASAYNAYQSVQSGANAASASAAPVSAISVSASIGTSKSESNSSSSQSTAQGSQLHAGGTLTISANGDATAGNGNLSMVGANVSAGKAANLEANGDISLLAAQNNVEIKSNNSSSNASIGATFTLGGQQNGLSFQAGVQGSRGVVNGQETTYTNTQIRVGGTDSPGTLSIKSGGDTTLQGAGASADHIKTDIGGDLKIESLKDKVTYDSQQQSVGGGVSVCVPPICYGTFVTVNVNAAESKIKADHDSVGAADEAAQHGQSGLKAGNGGFDVKVGGDTTLIGGVISSTQQAIDNNANNFSTRGTVTTQDIANHSDLDAHSVSVSLSTGSGSTGGAFGYGEVSDSEGSTTRAGISGVAGNQAVRTGDAEAGIKPVFTVADAEQVNKSLTVQTGITSEFGKNAGKAVGDFAGSQVKELKAQADKAKAAGDQAEYQRLMSEASKWEEGGVYRIGLHTIAGAMGGGVDGALGAAASAAAAPLLDEMQAKMTQSLIDAGMNPETAKATASLLTMGTAVALGGAAGGAQGATVAGNIDANNRLLHPTETQRIKDLAKGDPNKEARLAIAGCALVKCSAQYPEGSVEYNYWKAVETAGNQPEYASERNLLAQQTGTVGQRDQVTYSMFQYGWANEASDAVKRFDNTYGVSTRTLGTVQAITGGVATVTGATLTAGGAVTCPETGVGCLVAAGGVLVTGWGWDQATAGASTAISGQPQPTLGGQLISNTLGISAQAGELVYGLLGLSPAVVEAAVANNAANQAARINSMVRASYEEFRPQGIRITPDVMANPQVQAMMAEAKAANPTASTVEIERRVGEWLQSGSTMPAPATAAPGSVLIKIVPKGEPVSTYSPYWFTPEQARAVALMTPEQAAQVLGLPASQAARIISGGADYYAITAKAGTTPKVFVSDIAPTTQGSYVTAPSAQQVIVPNRTLWNAAAPIDPLTLRAPKQQ